ncbi:hypothetical protein PS6_004009 [Mucor atramentarius]
MDWILTQQKSQSRVPDVKDPNFYCCACERKLSNKRPFKNRLVGVPALRQSAPKKTSLEPAISMIFAEFRKLAAPTLPTNSDSTYAHPAIAG